MVGGGWSSPGAPPSELQCDALREVVARERQGALSCHVMSRKAW